MKRMRQALRRIDALLDGPGMGESIMWDLGVDILAYLLISICLAWVL